MMLMPFCGLLSFLRFFYFISTLTLSSSLPLGIANASIALLSLNQDLDFVELFTARHS